MQCEDSDLTPFQQWRTEPPVNATAGVALYPLLGWRTTSKKSGAMCELKCQVERRASVSTLWDVAANGAAYLIANLSVYLWIQYA